MDSSFFLLMEMEQSFFLLMKLEQSFFLLMKLEQSFFLLMDHFQPLFVLLLLRTKTVTAVRRESASPILQESGSWKHSLQVPSAPGETVMRIRVFSPAEVVSTVPLFRESTREARERSL